MDIQALLNLASTSFDQNGDGKLDMNDLAGALAPLLSSSAQPAGAAQNNLAALASGFNLSGVVAQLQQGGLSQVVSSWLGDGTNEPVSTDALASSLGQDKIAAFAERLGISPAQALSGLQNLLPQVIDQSSRGGELLPAAQGQGGLGSLLGGLASSFLKR
jgi:uncharacterized protein YidB (DUF937 family)